MSRAPLDYPLQTTHELLRSRNCPERKSPIGSTARSMAFI